MKSKNPTPVNETIVDEESVFKLDETGG